MITLQIKQSDIKNIQSEIKLKLDGVMALTGSQISDVMAESIFQITGKRFMSEVDRYAVSNPKKMHHLYEWNRIGQRSARLFVLNRDKIIRGSFGINTVFLPSKTLVPVPVQLSTPGKTGKSVTSRSVFRDKAKVMENGTPVVFQAKRTLAFLGADGIKFIPPGQVVRNLNPGGRETKNALATFMLEWYSRYAGEIIDSSGLYQTIIDETALVLNNDEAGPKQVVQKVTQLLQARYGIGGNVK
jgi:hypothetical protein